MPKGINPVNDRLLVLILAGVITSGAQIVSDRITELLDRQACPPDKATQGAPRDSGLIWYR